MLGPAAGLKAGHQLQQRGGVTAVARHLVTQLPVLLPQPGQPLLPLPAEWGQLSLDIMWQNHGIMGRRFPDNFLFFRPRLDV